MVQNIVVSVILGLTFAILLVTASTLKAVKYSTNTLSAAVAEITDNPEHVSECMANLKLHRETVEQQDEWMGQCLLAYVTMQELADVARTRARQCEWELSDRTVENLCNQTKPE